MQFDWSYRSIARPEIPGVHDLEPLGQGGMGCVYRGRDDLGRLVAVKVSRRMGKAALARFEREAQLLARFRAPEVVTAHAWGVTDDLAYLVTELVEGQTLDEAASLLSPAERVELLTAVARAVAVAHREGVVHRDLKPTNVLVTADGQVRLIDFGVSIGLDQERLTQTGNAVGTLLYMAPEQLQGATPSPSQDVWSLGVLGYELLTGRPPFEGDSLMALVAAQQRGPGPAGPEVPDALQAVLTRALSYAPARRYPHAEALAAALDAARVEPAAPPPWRAALTIAAVGAILVGLGAWSVSRGSAAPQEPPPIAASERPLPPPPDAEPAPTPERWPVAWEGSLSPEEAQRLAELTNETAELHLEFLEPLAARGAPKACRLLGLAYLVGAYAERDPERGYGLVVQSLRCGERHAADDLAPLFLGETPELAFSTYAGLREALDLEPDLELAAALSLIASTVTPRRKRERLARLFEAQGVRPPTAEAEAYAQVQERLEHALR